MLSVLKKIVPVIFVICLSVSPSQGEEKDKKDGFYELEEVVVTAERREEDLQDVPMAITALTGEELNDSVVESIVDLENRMTGLTFKTNIVLGQPYLRGIGSDIFSIGADPTVGIYVDGVYQARLVEGLVDFFDLERVEALKGPQGTLYGRNSTGGAFNIISKLPEPDFSMKADILYGNFNKVRSRAMINAPLVEDKVFLRLSSLTTNQDGFTKIVNRGTTTDGENLWSLRGQLRILATDNVEVVIRTDYLKERSSRALGHKVSSNFFAPQVNLFGGTNTGKPRELLANLDNLNIIDLWGSSGEVTWDLGSMEFKSISAFRESDIELFMDMDATEIDFGVSAPTENSKTFTQEFQLSSTNDGPFQWVTGLYYLREDASQEVDFILNAYGVRVNTYAENTVNAYALFGQVSYLFSDKWKLILGGRYSYENKEFVMNDLQNGLPVNNASKGWGAFMPKFVMEYLPNENCMAYFSLTRGFKSGGYNSVGVGEEFDPEFVWSYEVGLKTAFLNDRLKINAAAFYYDYKDLQVQRALEQAPSIWTLENAAQAEIKGLELEVFSRPFPGLDLNIALTIMNAEYTKFITTNPDALNPNLNQNLSGNSLPLAPDFSAYALLQYSWAFMDTMDMFIRGEWKYQSNVFFDQFNTQGISQGGYSLFNARFGVEGVAEHWSFALWGKNLTDKLYTQSMLRNTQVFGALHFWGEPRTFGFQATYVF